MIDQVCKMMPQHTFVSVDMWNAISLEWCFGGQGEPDSWRVLFCWDPQEGAMCCKTWKDSNGVLKQDYIEGKDSAKRLLEWIADAKDV